MNKLNHVAFIMDGNGRWGKKRDKGRNYGHIKGVKTVKKIVEHSIKLNVPIVTFSKKKAPQGREASVVVVLLLMTMILMT